MRQHQPDYFQRRNASALSFYNAKLRNDPNLRRLCEDRHVLDNAIDTWKTEEKLAGRSHKRISRSDIIYSLRIKWKLVGTVVKDENIIVWNEDGGKKKGGKKVGDKGKGIKKSSSQDKIKSAVERVRNFRKEVESNRNGIEVDKINFLGRGNDVEGEGKLFRPGERLSQRVYIHNRSESMHVVCTIKDQSARQRGIMVEGDLVQHLEPGSSWHVTVSLTPPNIGVIKSLVVFDISPIAEDFIKPFSIIRYIAVHVGDQDDYEIIKPSAPYIKQPRKRDNGKFSKPLRPERQVRMDFPEPLGRYGIPHELRQLSASREQLEQKIYRCYHPDDAVYHDTDGGGDTDFSSHLTVANYTRSFEHLLWVEESQMQVDIKTYDMTNAVITREGICFKLHVPGLAENRPSVLKGDNILVYVDAASKNRKFVGIVQRTSQEYAYLDFHDAFNRIFVNGLRVDVRFTFARTSLRTSHQALHQVTGESVMIDQMLFPSVPENSENDGDFALNIPLNSSIEQVSQIKFYNRALNPEQKAAVLGIIKSVARPRPYLIYGPPGTGKTVTLVESILQTLKAKGSDPNAKILVCAPSNTATDVVVERLIPFVTSKQMLRLIAYNRDKAAVPAQIVPYSNYDESSDCFLMPDEQTLKQYKIVAVTVSSGGKLPNYNIAGHFTHVFIDESGHSIEPETIACLVSVTNQDDNKNPPAIVLAGDPKQLGPIVRSSLAKKFGLEKSLLERLSVRDLYLRRETNESTTELYDSRMTTKLIRNYRSHPTILKLPNESFYDGDLLPCADPMISHSLTKWEHLPKKGFPIIFHGCQGDDQREGNSPSWFNPDEAFLVKTYVELLVKHTRSNRCAPEEIGIVTPYHKQVQKIRMLLGAHGYQECKVGSVEEFQGSERKVIIVSTVRSKVEYIEFDQKYQLGFVGSEKRFNVTITRAKALLIIIGNPFTLENDPHWKSIIDYSISSGGYKGCDYTKKEERSFEASVIEEVVSGIELNSSQENDDIEDEFLIVSHVTAQEGPAWRSEE